MLRTAETTPQHRGKCFSVGQPVSLLTPMASLIMSLMWLQNIITPRVIIFLYGTVSCVQRSNHTQSAKKQLFVKKSLLRATAIYTSSATMKRQFILGSGNKRNKALLSSNNTPEAERYIVWTIVFAIPYYSW